MLDFPAAHSMDTTWFAIDADGYVGIFNSGEEGAVPQKIMSLPEVAIECDRDLMDAFIGDRKQLLQYKSFVKIEPILPRLSMREELEWEDLSIEVLLKKIEFDERYAFSNSKHERERGEIDNLVLQLSSERVIEDLKSQAQIIIRFADEKILVYVDRCNLEWLKKAIELGTVIAGTETIYLEENLSWLGWYEYHGDYHGDDGYPVPYERIYSIERSMLMAMSESLILVRVARFLKI